MNPLNTHIPHHLNVISALRKEFGRSDFNKEFLKTSSKFVESEEGIRAHRKAAKAQYKVFSWLIVAGCIGLVLSIWLWLYWTGDSRSGGSMFNTVFALPILCIVSAVYLDFRRGKFAEFMELSRPVGEFPELCEKVFHATQANPLVAQYIQGVVAHRPLLEFDAQVALALDEMLNQKNQFELQKQYCAALHSA